MDFVWGCTCRGDRFLYGVVCLLVHIVDLRWTFTLALSSPPSPLLVYFEISISTHRRLNVDCNSRIDVLWPTHTHTHTYTRTPQVAAVVIVLHFCLVFNVISQRLLEQTDSTGGRTKRFVICCEDFFLSLDWSDTIWEKLQILIGLTANGFMRQYVCHTHTKHTHTHRQSLSRTGRYSGRHLAGSLPESFVFHRRAAPLVAATIVK